MKMELNESLLKAYNVKKEEPLEEGIIQNAVQAGTKALKNAAAGYINFVNPQAAKVANVAQDKSVDETKAFQTLSDIIGKIINQYDKTQSNIAKADAKAKANADKKQAKQQSTQSNTYDDQNQDVADQEMYR